MPDVAALFAKHGMRRRRDPLARRAARVPMAPSIPGGASATTMPRSTRSSRSSPVRGPRRDQVMHVISGLGTGGAESFLVALATRLRRCAGLSRASSASQVAEHNADKLAAAGIPVSRAGCQRPWSRRPRPMARCSTLVDARKAGRHPGLDVPRRSLRHVHACPRRPSAAALLEHPLLGHAAGGLSAAIAHGGACVRTAVAASGCRVSPTAAPAARCTSAPATSRGGMEIIPNGIDTVRFRPDARCPRERPRRTRACPAMRRCCSTSPASIP